MSGEDDLKNRVRNPILATDTKPRRPKLVTQKLDDRGEAGALLVLLSPFPFVFSIWWLFSELDREYSDDWWMAAAAAASMWGFAFCAGVLLLLVGRIFVAVEPRPRHATTQLLSEQSDPTAGEERNVPAQSLLPRRRYG